MLQKFVVVVKKVVDGVKKVVVLVTTFVDGVKKVCHRSCSLKMPSLISSLGLTTIQ